MVVQNSLNIDPHVNQHVINVSHMQQLQDMQDMQRPLAMQHQLVQPPLSRLHEEDVIRIAHKMKEVIKFEKSQLVEQRVALKTQPLTKEVSDLRKDFAMAQTEL